MSELERDAIVIAIVVGAVQAGPSVADRLTASGQTAAVIEGKHFGGIDARTAKIPALS